MAQTGELKQLWDVASVTNVRINLVRFMTACTNFLTCPSTLAPAPASNLTETLTAPVPLDIVPTKTPAHMHVFTMLSNRYLHP